jgi:AcrR family transcriptional regulator
MDSVSSDPVGGRSPTASNLLDTAVSLLEREGPEALTVRRVSEAAGMSTIGIYSHFQSKEGLIGAVWGVGFARLAASLREAATGGPEGVVELGKRYLFWAIEHPHLYGLMFGRSRGDIAVDDEARAASRAAFDLLVDACSAVIDRATGDAEATALSVWQYLHGVASLEIAGMSPPGTIGESDPASVIRRLLG